MDRSPNLLSYGFMLAVLVVMSSIFYRMLRREVEPTRRRDLMLAAAGDTTSLFQRIELVTQSAGTACVILYGLLLATSMTTLVLGLVLQRFPGPINIGLFYGSIYSFAAVPIAWAVLMAICAWSCRKNRSIPLYTFPLVLCISGLTPIYGTGIMATLSMTSRAIGPDSLPKIALIGVLCFAELCAFVWIFAALLTKPHQWFLREYPYREE